MHSKQKDEKFYPFLRDTPVFVFINRDSSMNNEDVCADIDDVCDFIPLYIYVYTCEWVSG